MYNYACMVENNPALDWRKYPEVYILIFEKAGE